MRTGDMQRTDLSPHSGKRDFLRFTFDIIGNQNGSNLQKALVCQLWSLTTALQEFAAEKGMGIRVFGMTDPSGPELVGGVISKSAKFSESNQNDGETTLSE